jgi:hypothetical protein
LPREISVRGPLDVIVVNGVALATGVPARVLDTSRAAMDAREKRFNG